MKKYILKKQSKISVEESKKDNTVSLRTVKEASQERKFIKQ